MEVKIENAKAGHAPFDRTLQYIDVFLQNFSNLDKGNVVLILMHDLSVAFDYVDQDIFLNRFDMSHGIRFSLSLVVDVLPQRQNYIRHKRATSTFEIILVGVPKGAILWLLQFLLYTYDVHQTTMQHDS